MNYIKGIFNFLPGITTLFRSRQLATLYLMVHWFFAYLLVDFALEIFSMIGYGEPLLNGMVFIDMFTIGAISLALVATFYYYYIIGKTYKLVTK